MSERFIRSGGFGAGFLLALLWAAVPSADAQDALKRYQIPEQALSSALIEFSRQSGVNVVVEPALVAGKRSPAVDGEMSATIVLARLLEGSGLSAQLSSDNTVLVQQGGGEGTAGGEAGEVRGGGETEGGSQGVELDEIVVTGTHIRGVTPGSSPVMVFRNEEIRATGATTLDQFFNKLPQNFAALSGVPTLFVGNRGESNSSSTAGIDLRGLGPGSTLVLVNGRRLAPSSGGRSPDISLIPLNAVDRVEMLTDGASAVYGADAVGGVVNFILRQNHDGASTTLGYGGVTNGSLHERRFEQTFGKSWSTGGGLLSYSFLDRSALEAGSRDYTAAAGRFDLFPEERRNGAMIGIHQDLPAQIRLSGELLHAKHDTRTIGTRTLGDPTFEFVSDIRNDSEQTFANLGFERPFAGDTMLGLFASYSHARADSAVDTIFFGDVTPLREDESASSTDITVKWDGKALELPAGPLRFSLGAGHERDRYRFSSVFLGLGDPQGSRNDRTIDYAFSEIFIPFVNADQGVRGARRLELSLAGRYSSFSDFGDDVSPRVGLLWSPAEGLSLRGTYSESFKVPFLPQLTANGSYIPFEPTNDVWSGDGSSLLLYVQGNNPRLGPERSTAHTFGVDLQPAGMPGLTLSATYFDISYEDRVETGDPTGGFLALTVPETLPDLLLLDPTAADIERLLVGGHLASDDDFGIDFNDPAAVAAAINVVVDNRLRNLGLSELDGMDFSGRYDLTIGATRLKVGIELSYLFDSVQKITPSAPRLEVIDVVLTPADLKARTSLGLTRGAWSTQLNLNYVDDYSDPYSIPARDVASWTTLDANMSYAFTGGWLADTSVALNVQNLFDRDPPFVAVSPGDALDEPIGYDPANASPLGRFIALEMHRIW